MKHKDYTCKTCGTVAFGITRESALAEVKSFNDYYDSLSRKKQEDNYGGIRSSIVHYERCTLCGNRFKDFRETVKGDCPDGCTLGPIIVEE